MGTSYYWTLAMHLWGVILWAGGTLSALIVTDTPETARRLMRRVAHPGAALSVVAGMGLVTMHPGWLTAGWLHAKLGLVLILIGLDLLLTIRLAAARRPAGWVAPAIVVLVAAIVALATVKGF